MSGEASRDRAGGTRGQTEIARRWRASPLLIDDSVPDEVIGECVDTLSLEGDVLLAVPVELDLRTASDPTDAYERFREVHHLTLSASDSRPKPYQVSAPYVRCLLSRQEIVRLLQYDQRGTTSGSVPPQTIFRIWPDYILRPQVDHSASTIKVDAAARTYTATGAGVVWAVLDTGIDADHPHFSEGTLDDPVVRGLHRDFTYVVRDEPEPDKFEPLQALVDTVGHGTHVAGIIAGRMPSGHRARAATLEASFEMDRRRLRWTERPIAEGRILAGMAPATRLVSLKILDDSRGDPVTTSSAVIKALEHVRRINAWGRVSRIHGVNLSFGCPWYYRDYAAGQSPLCKELNLLVSSGVIAVVSAGNSGFGTGLETDAVGTDLHGVLSTITDPANAENAITVGSTHRDSPHLFGVTYSSSKGPTLDGRLKPDLVAPGEHITSCATGRLRARIPVFAPANESGPRTAPSPPEAFYAEDSGTSMAAPHVSGAISAFLSVRREFIGRPDEIKRLMCETAVPLGRDRFFEGHGLIDVMAALSRV